jgi:hypothetical protein
MDNNYLATTFGVNKTHTWLYITQQGGLGKIFGTAMYAACEEKYSRDVTTFKFPPSRFLTVSIISSKTHLKLRGHKIIKHL